jgi:hypothetical protein
MNSVFAAIIFAVFQMRSGGMQLLQGAILDSVIFAICGSECLNLLTIG